MTKTKEYLELITSEMEGFKTKVNKLENINENLNNLKIAIDLKGLKAELYNFQNQLEHQHIKQKELYTRLEALHRKLLVSLKYLFIGGAIVMFFTVFILLYVYGAYPT